MDEMDYDMHNSPNSSHSNHSSHSSHSNQSNHSNHSTHSTHHSQTTPAQPQSHTVPRCPYLLPNPSRPMNSGNTYDPVHPPSGLFSWGLRPSSTMPPSGPSSWMGQPMPQDQPDRSPPSFDFFQRMPGNSFGFQSPSLPVLQTPRPAMSETPLFEAARPESEATGVRNGGEPALSGQSSGQIVANSQRPDFGAEGTSSWGHRFSASPLQNQSAPSLQQQQQQQQQLPSQPPPQPSQQQGQQATSSHSPAVQRPNSSSRPQMAGIFSRISPTNTRSEETMQQHSQMLQGQDWIAREEALQASIQRRQQELFDRLQQQDDEQLERELEEQRDFELEQQERRLQQQQTAGSVTSQSSGAQLPRVSSILNASQPPEALMPMLTGFQNSPSPSQDSASPTSTSPDSVSMPQSQSSGPSRPSTRPILSINFGSAATQPLESPPLLSHTTLDRAYWESSGQRARLGNSAGSAGSAVTRPETSQAAGPPAAASTSTGPPASAVANNEQRNRGSVRHRRSETGTGSNSGSSTRTPDLDSDDELESINASLLEEQNALHTFIEHVESGLFTGSVRARQMLRGTMPNRRVASKGAIASLLSVDIDSLAPTERTCIICYNDFGVPSPEGINEAPLRLPKCKHVFGDHCIKKWFEESDSCPYCRDKVPSELLFRPNQAAFHQLLRTQPGRTNRNSAPLHFHTQTFVHETYARLIGGERDAPLQDLTTPALSNGQQGRSFVASDRRVLPEDINEGQRRTRPRHGTFRTPVTTRTFGSVSNAQPSPSGRSSTNHASHSFSRHLPPQIQAVQPLTPALRPPAQQMAQQPQAVQNPPPLPVPTMPSRDRCVNPYGNQPYVWQPSPAFTRYGPPPASDNAYRMPHYSHGPTSTYGPGNGSGSMQQGAANANRMSYPSYQTAAYGAAVTGNEPGAGFLHAQQAPGLPPPSMPEIRHHRHYGSHNHAATQAPSMPATTQVSPMEPLSNASASLSSPFSQHPQLPPISRFDMINRYAGSPPSSQDSPLLPSVTTGWGPS